MEEVIKEDKAQTVWLRIFYNFVLSLALLMNKFDKKSLLALLKAQPC